ncbi:MAG: hypothetical protein N4A49_00395 [Marinifilaceae bacterium]|jgi:hypothetical protein|nr:hypothetical protein [Marinifilaceae bacterium]
MRTTFKYFLGLAACLLMAQVSMAQWVDATTAPLGDGDNPYVGNEYTYTVTTGTPAGTAKVWAIFTDKGTTAALAADYTMTGINTGSAKITWKKAGTYYLRYAETLNGCTTYRGQKIVVSENNFYITLAADGDKCNVEAGNVLDWTTYETKADNKTDLVYTVTRHTEAGFTIDSWKFEATIDLPTGISIDAGELTTNDAGCTVTNTTGSTYTFTGITKTDLVITVKAKGKVTDGGNLKLTLSKGIAMKGALELKDNELRPSNVEETNAALRDRIQTMVLKPLPAASNIQF